MAAMKIHVTCQLCRLDRTLTADTPSATDRDRWESLRVTYMPDERAYLTWPCSECGEWQAKKLSLGRAGDLISLGIPVDDLSLVDADVERVSMPVEADADFRLDTIARTPRLLDLAIEDLIHRSRPRRVNPPKAGE